MKKATWKEIKIFNDSMEDSQNTDISILEISNEEKLHSNRVKLRDITNTNSKLKCCYYPY